MPPVPATDKAIACAAHAIRDGHIVAFPTETVYGLGADATNGVAAARIFEAKGRPRLNPLIVHVPDIEAAKHYCTLNKAATQLAENFWPGPLSIVVTKRARANIAELVTAGLDTIALRVPSHPVAQALLREAERPVAAPSANRSGRTSPTTAAHVFNDLADEPAMILDGGQCPLGIESTIVAITDETPQLLRPGAITRDQLAHVLGHAIEQPRTHPHGTVIAPGQLASHYAPKAKLRLNAIEPQPGEAFLAFGGDAPGWDGPKINLSPAGNMREAAANLFGALRTLDEKNPDTIAVSPIPQSGLGEAINDRLARASAPR